jgi:hypothetical protein
MAFPWGMRVFPAFMGKIVSVYRNKKRPNISIVLENARIMIAFCAKSVSGHRLVTDIFYPQITQICADY